MKSQILPCLVSLCLFIFFSADASAFYHAQLGRFLNRDPAAEILNSQRAHVPGTQVGRFVERNLSSPNNGVSAAGITMTMWNTELPANGSVYVDGYNLYQYVRDNPVTYVDPSGLYQ